MDVETSVLDKYAEQRVDSMVDAGLLDEVCDIYKPGADYTRGIRQSIGVREFEDILKLYLPERSSSPNGSILRIEESKHDKVMKKNLIKILDLPKDDKLRIMLEEAIDRVKLEGSFVVKKEESVG